MIEVYDMRDKGKINHLMILRYLLKARLETSFSPAYENGISLIE